MLRLRPRLAWALPLAVPSYLMFAGSRALIYQMARFSGARPQRWQFQTPETIEKMVPLIMVLGPRWNTHAVVFNAAVLFRVERRLVVRCPDPARVPWWSAVIRDRSRRTHRHIGTTRLAPGQDAFELDLPPGLYSIAFRYYAFHPVAHTPAVEADGRTVLPRTPLPPGATLDVYEAVRGRTGPVYRALAHHVEPLLHLRAWLPDGFVQRTFLPVGDPNNTFLFDVFERGERLRIEIPSGWLATHRALFTAYNRASFPVRWFEVEAPMVETAPMAGDGFWLLRVHALAGGTPRARAEDARVIRLSPAESRGGR